METESNLVKEARILLHPTRYKIAKLLAEKPMRIGELTEALGEDRRLVSYHLLTLQDYGFVRSEFDFPAEEERAAGAKTLKRYGVTEKGRVSYRLLILEENGYLDAGQNMPKKPGLKECVRRKYSTTDKVKGVLSELKKEF